MKYIDEYRDKELVLKLTNEIRSISKKSIALMEVCGGHTMSMYRFGLPSLLPKNIKLLSGPGCPVCVSDKRFIDQAIAYSRLEDVIITTFGDLVRIPGSTSTLAREKANGATIRTVYSPLEALATAKANPTRKVIFLGVGFETTAPTSAAAIQEASQKNIRNFYLLSSHKIMPPAMSALIDEGVRINGYICPGHVSAITGSEIYEPIAKQYGRSCVISGFEPVDLMQSIYLLVKQQEENAPKVEIQYKRVVNKTGNPKAKQVLDNVFELRDDWWRGLGILPLSGLRLREKYANFDAEQMIPVEVEKTRNNPGCICGEILKGQKEPKDCKLFAKACLPGNPIGACMVSSEGACAARYRYDQ